MVKKNQTPEEKEVSAKLVKITSYIKKTERRINMHEKALEKIRAKISEERKTLEGLVSEMKNRVRQIT